MKEMEVDYELSWINDLKVQNEINRDELREALSLVNSYRTVKDMKSVENLRENLTVIRQFIRNGTNLDYVQIRRIAHHIRTYTHI